MNEQSESIAREHAERAEIARRDYSQSIDTRPLAPGVSFDYASAGLKMDQARHHLDESIPNAQHTRTREAFLLMRQGVEELACWLRSKGVDV
jgi:hypothetical protein